MTAPPPASGSARDVLPCPWCGSLPKVQQHSAMVGGVVTVGCIYEHCSARPTIVGRDHDSAIERWNRRAPVPAAEGDAGAAAVAGETDPDILMWNRRAAALVSAAGEPDDREELKWLLKLGRDSKQTNGWIAEQLLSAGFQRIAERDAGAAEIHQLCNTVGTLLFAVQEKETVTEEMWDAASDALDKLELVALRAAPPRDAGTSNV